MGLLEILGRAQKIAKLDTIVVSQGEEVPSDLDSEAGQCVIAAVHQYSSDVPEEVGVVVTVNPDGSPVYPLALIDPEWIPRSYLVSQVCTNLATPPPIPMPPEWYHVRTNFGTGGVGSTAEVLEFLQDPPSEDFGLYYTRPYSIDPFAEFRIREEAAEYIAHLAAGKMLSMAANYFARKAERTLVAAERVEYHSHSERYTKRQAAVDLVYQNGVRADASAFAWGTVTWSTTPSDGTPNIFHRRLR